MFIARHASDDYDGDKYIAVLACEWM